MIVSMIDIYGDTVTRNKLKFPSTITCILTHLHITTPSSPLFQTMGAISKESIRRSDVQLAAKRPYVKPTPAQQNEATFHATEGAAKDATYASQPSSSSTPSSYGVKASLAAIMDQLQHMHDNCGSHLDHISDEMCQMNTRIGRIAHRQSCLGGMLIPFHLSLLRIILIVEMMVMMLLALLVMMR